MDILHEFSNLRVRINKIGCVFLHSVNNVGVCRDEKNTIRFLSAINQSCVWAKQIGSKFYRWWGVCKIYYWLPILIKTKWSKMLLSPLKYDKNQ